MKFFDLPNSEEKKQFRKDAFWLWSLNFNIPLQIVGFGLILYFWEILPPQIPFFFSLPWGEEQLASPASLLLLMLSSIIITIINSVAAFLVFPRSSFLAHLLFLTSVATTALIVLTVLQIILVIT
ncbi:hypothetical protein C4579_00245 [Candidatus Microgenomates bacterium]|nr:MAG: hypothetical protein C4579_00245 [Candidatus Microgenomates bacterium]